MPDPVLDEEEHTSARVEQLEEEHARLVEELAALRVKAAHEGQLPTKERLEIRIRELKGELAESQKLVPKSYFDEKRVPIIAAAIPFIMFLLIVLAIVFRKK